jgi:hypothetical protein
MKTFIRFTLLSVDGDEGYPGNLKVKSIYLLAKSKNELTFEFYADTDQPTPVNLTNVRIVLLTSLTCVACLLESRRSRIRNNVRSSTSFKLW